MGWSFRGFLEDFTLKAGTSLKSCEGTFRKFHLILILLENSWKSFLNYGSSIFPWIGANSIFFLSTLISESELHKEGRLKEDCYKRWKSMYNSPKGNSPNYSKRSYRWSWEKLKIKKMHTINPSSNQRNTESDIHKN